jgi:hypothetical protein
VRQPGDVATLFIDRDQYAVAGAMQGGGDGGDLRRLSDVVSEQRVTGQPVTDQVHRPARCAGAGKGGEQRTQGKPA